MSRPLPEGAGGDEKEEVGPDGAFVVDAGDVGKDGRNVRERAQKQDVGIVLYVEDVVRR